MNRLLESDDANTTQYVWDKYVYLVFAILTGIGLATVFIPVIVVKPGINSELISTLFGSTLFLQLIGKFLNEIGRKKLSKVVGITSMISFLGMIITMVAYGGIFILIPIFLISAITIFLVISFNKPSRT